MQIMSIGMSGGAAKLDKDMFESTEEMVIFGVVVLSKVADKTMTILNDHGVECNGDRQKDFVVALQKHYCDNLMPELLKRHRVTPLTPLDVRPEVEGLAQSMSNYLMLMWGCESNKKALH